MRKTIVVLVSCTVLLLLGYSGYRAYELWKQTHWMTLAKGFAARLDWQNESLSLQQVLALNPRNLEACRMAADLAQRTGSPDALVLRKKVVELDPNSADDRLNLAQTAMMAHDYDTAAASLAAVDAMGKKDVAYYNIAGQLALVMGKADEAEADFTEAIHLDPSNPAPQISLAVIQLHTSNTLDMAEARITLRRLSQNSTNAAIRAQADRELVSDALRFGDSQTALWFSKHLLQLPNAAFFDKLMRLDVLKTVHHSEYASQLAVCEQEAATNSANLYNLTLWFLKYNLPSQALSWLNTLPAATQTNIPGALLIGQCQILLHNWSGLQNSLSKQNWGPLDFTRQAFIARAMQQQGLYEASKAEWVVAVNSANGQDDNLKSLFRLAVEWNWQDEARQILWAIIKNYPQEQWAEQDLAQSLYNSGDTRPLMQLFSIQADRDPTDLSSRNNLALTAMLLRAQEMNPYDLARQVYQQAPTNGFFACTYAFSLYLQQKNADALKIMRQIPPQYLKNNSTAGYYGLVLKASGDNASAMAYLKYALQGKLLPEERALFQQAMIGP